MKNKNSAGRLMYQQVSVLVIKQEFFRVNQSPNDILIRNLGVANLFDVSRCDCMFLCRRRTCKR